MLNMLPVMLGRTKEAWPFASYQGLENVIRKYETFVYFHSKHGKDTCFASDAIDRCLNPRT
jgi:hypothetical protein